jgi:hypothetical protein
MPPKGDTEVLEPEISNIVDDAGDAKASEKPASAAPSTATDVSNTVADDALSVVRDVVDKRTPETAASSATVDSSGQPTGDQPTKQPDDENFSDVPFNKHPRFQQVLGRLKTAEVDAVRYRNVQNYLDQNGLDAPEAAELLAIGGLMKVNPIEAWKRMKPTIQKLLIAAGEVLPDDLKDRVTKGELTADAAMEVSRSRATVDATQAQRTFEQQRSETTRTAEVRDSLMNAAASWEADRRLRDPNFDAKLPAVQKEVVWLQSQEGKPNTPQGVQEQLRKAYEAVSATVAPVTPTPRPKPAITPVNGGQVTGDVHAAPQSTLDIIKGVVAKSRAR